jgi:hypothetical protein
VDIDLHFVRERAAISEVRVVHVPSTSQFTDVFIKGTFFSLLEVSFTWRYNCGAVLECICGVCVLGCTSCLELRLSMVWF